MNIDKNTSKCISCTCTGCHNFKDNDAKETALNQEQSDLSKISKQ